MDTTSNIEKVVPYIFMVALGTSTLLNTYTSTFV